jgi:hypothetical protein
MRAFSVEIEARILGDAEAAAEGLLGALERRGDLAPVVSAGRGSLAARFDVPARDPAEAARAAVALWTDAVAGLHASVGEIELLEVTTPERLERELERDDEELLGVSEIAELLGVSRQRVSELRRRPGFPAPLAELAAGPVWKRTQLERFVARWPRRPGRPKARAGQLGVDRRPVDGGR